MKGKDEALEKTCFNCSYCITALATEPTEYGICLNDEAFEPFMEELLDDLDYSSCQDLIEQKKFLGDREACPDFEWCDSIEIDDDSPLGRELRRLEKAGKLTAETFENAVIEEQLRKIDWKTVSVDNHVGNLKSADPKKRAEAIRSLGGLAGLGNRAAFETLFDFLRSLPPPTTVEQVHLKRDLLHGLETAEERERVAPFLIDELLRIPSNNTTRQWLSDIFRFLERCPWEEIHEPLERMLEERRFSPKFKDKIQETLFRSRDRFSAMNQSTLE